MDDLIVIILTLIFIVAGLYRQVKKQRATAENKANIPSTKDNPWELPDQEWEEPSLSRVNVETKKTTPEPKKKPFLNPENEGERIIPRDLFKETQINRAEKSVRKKRFPLRDAIIYSEILKRKYI